MFTYIENDIFISTFLLTNSTSKFYWENINLKERFYIYALICPKINKVRYVGLTINLYKRFCNHIYCTDKKINWKENWLNQLKKEKIRPTIIILDSSNDLKEANSKETNWIIQFSKNGNLTNHDKLITSNYSYSCLGQHKNKKIVYQYNSNGNYLNSYNSLKEITEKFDIKYSYLSSSIKNNNLLKDYYWSFNKEEKICIEPKNKDWKSCTKIYQFNSEGILINKFNSLYEASESTKIHRTSITEVVNGFYSKSKKPKYKVRNYFFYNSENLPIERINFYLK